MKIPIEFIKIYTNIYQGEQINNIILNFVDKESTITDSTAGIGGNSILFCKTFKFVNVVEKEYNLNIILKENLNDFNNKKILIGSYNIFKYIIKQDVIFMDPPWGGNNYKLKNNINLFLDNINVLDIIDKMFNYCRLICLKVPNNFNFKTLKTNFWNINIYNVHSVLKKKRPIYSIIIFFK